MTSDSTLIHDAELPADSTDAPDEWVELGRTAGAYGFKGWVRIAPLASGEVLEHTRNWELVDTAGVRTPVRVKGLRRHGAGLIAKWDGCESSAWRWASFAAISRRRAKMRCGRLIWLDVRQ